MEANYLEVKKTARYFTLGNLTEKTDTIWFVLHGYGQLAQYFIQKFTPLLDEKTVIIAPEALSRFYLTGFSGRVGATWMTKEDRENEIKDYCNYLNQLYKHITGQINNKKITFNLLGFSQGVPALCRWIDKFQPEFNKLILWAGIFPPDMNTDFIFSPEYIQNHRTYIIYGNEDPLLKEEHIQQIEEFKKNIKNLSVIIFEGKHEIDPNVLPQIK
ncbi:MAG TPA: hypothetical protein VIK89_16105 [Cytophagaceae bacterium]